MMGSDYISGWKRTTYCGDLRIDDVDKKVTLFGWVHKHRDLGNLVFIDLRDRQGVIQVVIGSNNQKLLEKAKKLRMEYVLGIRGTVKARD